VEKPRVIPAAVLEKHQAELLAAIGQLQETMNDHAVELQAEMNRQRHVLDLVCGYLSRLAAEHGEKLPF
jgi:hypothetical protein